MFWASDPEVTDAMYYKRKNPNQKLKKTKKKSKFLFQYHCIDLKIFKY